MRVTIVIPCYNEERRLPADEFRAFPGVEFLFVNDGSRDGTLKVLQSLAASDPSRLSVLNLEKNGGKAEAVRRGILAAMARKPDIVGFWDADLATPLTEIPLFLEIFEARPEIEMVFAARVRLLGRNISRRAQRHYVGRVGATLISSTLKLAVYDTQCGAKMFRAGDAMGDVFATPFLSRWIFDVEIIARFVQQRGRDAAARAIYELPVREWHDIEGSKVGGLDFLRSLRDLWRIRKAYRQ